VFVLAAWRRQFVHQSLMSSGADPWIAYQNGYYYLTYTSGSNVRLRQGRKLTGPAGVAEAKAKTVFTPAAPYNKNVWAPELHFIQGRTYLYFAADDGDNANPRMYVAQGHANGTPTSFTSKERSLTPPRIGGRLMAPCSKPTTARFTSSGPLAGRGGWTPKPLHRADEQPVDHQRSARPAFHAHRTVGKLDSGRPCHPQAHGMVFLVYAANKSWTDNECIGLLVNTDGNYLNPASWTKQPQPIFSHLCRSGWRRVRAGALQLHAIVGWHGRLDFLSRRQKQRRGWGSQRAHERISWAANGYPVLGRPVPAGILLDGRRGTISPCRAITEVAPQTGRKIRIRGQAPLPLQTNRWTIEYSGNLSRWHTLSNVSGLQFAAEVVESLTFVEPLLPHPVRPLIFLRRVQSASRRPARRTAARHG
jgi:GH43 family beta-xylosidase